MKTYSDYINEINKDELYKGLLAHGLFTDKLPPVFSSEDFYELCINSTTNFENCNRDYVKFDCIRNTGTPRQFGIPNPFSYKYLCEVLKENWDKIKNYFNKQTRYNHYKISRIHIRKIANKDSLFEMNYDNWINDGEPTEDLMIGNRFVVHADISTCFPSIYTHTLTWALVGKKKAKTNRSGNWYNKIDIACQKTRNGETHGLIIGPHAYNLLSEIILVNIDRKLRKWNYVRNIDDYTCYVKNEEEAQKFLINLNKELQAYDLLLNQKKISIEPLPILASEKWMREINSFNLISKYGITYKEVSRYFDLVIDLTRTTNNAACINYAIKRLSGEKDRMTPNAKAFCLKECIHLTVLYPYLLSIVDDYVFKPYGARKEEIKSLSNMIYKDSIKTLNYEGIRYSIYFSLKYKFEINGLKAKEIISTNDCLSKLFGMLYFKRLNNNTELDKFKVDAKNLLDNNEMDRNWIYIYETLNGDCFTNDWRYLKNHNISFIRMDF